MTKREYLVSKGYTPYLIGFSKIICFANSEFYLRAYIRAKEGFLFYFCLEPRCFVKTQKDIDNLQIAYNNVKRDFEEMQKYED